MKNKSAITLLFVSNIISGFAQGISMMAIPWYFIEIVNEPSLFTFAYAIITFLTLFWGLYAGTIIDRYPRKTVFIITNIICGTIIATVAASGYYLGDVNHYLVLLVFGVTIFNYNIHYPNLYAFGQEITEQRNYGKLNSYIEIQGQVTSMMAGAFAAILLSGSLNNEFVIAGISIPLPFNIEPWSIQKVFLMDAITYFIGVGIFFFIRYTPISTKEIHKGTLFTRLKGGFTYLKQNRSIFYFGVFSYMLFAFTLVEVHVLLPGYVKRFLNESVNVYASAEVYYSFGAILSGILIFRIFQKYSAYLGVVFLMIVVSFAFLSMSFYENIWLFFLANLVLGICNAGVRILRTTYLFTHVPNNVIGRANSLFSSINVLVRSLMIFFFSLPFFLEGNNIRWGYFIGAIFVILSVVPLLLSYKKEKKIVNKTT
jgi:MFS family permease